METITIVRISGSRMHTEVESAAEQEIIVTEDDKSSYPAQMIVWKPYPETTPPSDRSLMVIMKDAYGREYIARDMNYYYGKAFIHKDNNVVAWADVKDSEVVFKKINEIKGRKRE